MQFFEGIFAIVLSTLLLISIISISQSVKTRFEKLEEMRTDLALESSLAEIPFQKLSDAEALLSEVIRILNSNGIKWVSIEILSEKNDRISVWNREASSHPGGRDTRYVRVVRVNGKDTVHIVVER